MRNNDSNPELSHCVFRKNTAYAKGGGAMYNDHGSPTLSNCTFSGNEAWFIAGGMYNDNGSNPLLTDCTFIENTAFLRALNAFDAGDASRASTLLRAYLEEHQEGRWRALAQLALADLAAAGDLQSAREAWEALPQPRRLYGLLHARGMWPSASAAPTAGP